MYLNKIAQHEKKNKMSPDNLATVFAPTLLRPKQQKDMLAMLNDSDLGLKIIKMFIIKHEQLFRCSHSEMEDKLIEQLGNREDMKIFNRSMKKGTAKLAQGFMKDALSDLNSRLSASESRVHNQDLSPRSKNAVWTLFEQKEETTQSSSLEDLKNKLEAASLSVEPKTEKNTEFTPDQLVEKLIEGDSDFVQNHLNSLPLTESKKIASAMSEKLRSMNM